MAAAHVPDIKVSPCAAIIFLPLFRSLFRKSPRLHAIFAARTFKRSTICLLFYGARLDASSFVHETSGNRLPKATESWSAIWKTPDEEDVLKLAWDLGTGWAITYDHQGKEILSAQGKAQALLSEVVGAHHAAFADALAQQLWHIDSRWADNEQSNPLGHEAAVGHTQNVRQREGTRVCRCLFEPRIK